MHTPSHLGTKLSAQMRLPALILAFISLLVSPLRSWADTPSVQVNDGWASSTGYVFSGQVLGDNHTSATKDSGKLKSFYRNMRLLFASGEESIATWSVGNLQWQTYTNEDGHYHIASSAVLNLPAGWHTIDSALGSTSKGQLLVHSPQNHTGIISDIDDTIMVSEVNNKKKLLVNSLTINPDKRLAVRGIAALYQNLSKANPAPEASPIFYVSASPVALTDNIRQFLDKNAFPKGVLMLKRFRGPIKDSATQKKDYKLNRIETVLLAFPQTQFYLIGDDGEGDPEAFAALQMKYPSQIKASLIRRVNPNSNRPRFAGQLDLDQVIQAGGLPQ